MNKILIDEATVQQEPVAGEGKEFSEQLCARNVAFVAAGRVGMSSAAMQEMFAILDHFCVGIDSPQPAQPKPLTDELCEALEAAVLSWIDDWCKTTGFEEVEAQVDAAIEAYKAAHNIKENT